MNGPTLEICRGLPASGKTTYARARLEARLQQGRRGSLMRSNRDDYRRMVLDTGYRRPEHGVEDLVTVAQHAAILALLRRDVDVVCDDTNLCVDHVEALMWLARTAGAKVIVTDFTDVALEECIRRDWLRGPPDHVGELVIRRMYERYIASLNGAPLPLPDVDLPVTRGTV